MADEYKPVRISVSNYAKLTSLKLDLFNKLQASGVYRNVDFDDVITELLLDKENKENKEGELKWI